MTDTPAPDRPLRRVLLLGGTGFIGSRVLACLRTVPDVRILLLGHANVNYRELEDINLVVGSLTNFDLSWLEIFRPDTIIHLARLPGKGRMGRARAARRGRRANTRLIKWLSANAPQTRVVYVSGTLVYGNHGDEEGDENCPVQPISFAREYILAEKPWMEAQAAGILPVTIVRPPWVVGPGSWFDQYYLAPAQREGAVPVYGDGQNWMTLVDVDDCAGAVVHLALHAASGGVYNVFTPGQSVRQSEFSAALADSLGLPVQTREIQGAAEEAIRDALTSSFKAGTCHAQACSGYEFQWPEWRDILKRHITGGEPDESV